jgi:hypothetical protein
MWESRLSGSERGRAATRTTGEIMWHRRKTRRQTENTNFALPSGECPVYSKRRSRYRTLGDLWGVPRSGLWEGTNMIGMVESRREVNGKVSTEKMASRPSPREATW